MQVEQTIRADSIWARACCSPGLDRNGRTPRRQEALELGIATRLMSEEKLVDQARTAAVQLAAVPTRALGAAKRLMHGGGNETLEALMERESQAIADIARTADSGDGSAAFPQKRTAQFSGK